MTRRRGNLQADSLELLLDTICNTFGGILFIALLVALLARETPSQKDTTDADPATRPIAAYEEEFAEVSGEVRSLEALAEGQDSMLPTPDQLGSQEGLKQDLKELEVLRQKQRDLALQRREISDRLLEDATEERKSQETIAKINKEILQREQEKKEDLKRLLDEEEDLKTREEELKSSLATSKKGEHRQIRFSTVRDSAAGKTFVGVTLRFGRLYVWHKYGPSGERLGVNTDDFVILGEDRRRILTMPRLDAGVPLRENPKVCVQIKQHLEHLSPNRVVIEMVVWPDSYVDFATARNCLAAQGYAYAVMGADETSVIIDRGGSRRGVQ